MGQGDPWGSGALGWVLTLNPSKGTTPPVNEFRPFDFFPQYEHFSEFAVSYQLPGHPSLNTCVHRCTHTHTHTIPRSPLIDSICPHAHQRNHQKGPFPAHDRAFDPSSLDLPSLLKTAEACSCTLLRPRCKCHLLREAFSEPLPKAGPPITCHLRAGLDHSPRYPPWLPVCDSAAASLSRSWNKAGCQLRDAKQVHLDQAVSPSCKMGTVRAPAPQRHRTDARGRE